MPKIQLLPSSNSPPNPTVPPTLVSERSKDTESVGLTSRWSIPAKATPPFRYHIQLLMVKPMRGVTVASHFTSVVQRSSRKSGNSGPTTVFLTPDQVPLASRPMSQLGPICQL